MCVDSMTPIYGSNEDDDDYNDDYSDDDYDDDDEWLM